MIELLGGHRPDDGCFVRHFGEVGQEFAHPSAGLPSPLELIRRAQHLRDAFDESEALALEQMLGAVGAAVLLEFGLGIEQLQL